MDTTCRENLVRLAIDKDDPYLGGVIDCLFHSQKEKCNCRSKYLDGRDAEVSDVPQKRQINVMFKEP